MKILKSLCNNVGPDGPFTGDAGDGVADPASTGQVMKFIVNLPFNASIPDATVIEGTKLRQPIQPLLQTGVTREVVLFEGRDEYGRLQPILGTLNDGSMSWAMPISEKPTLNDVEMWEIYNTTMDAHPIHLHLVNFQILNRESFTGTVEKRSQIQHNGTTGIGGQLLANTVVLGNDARPPAANESGLKDMVVAYPGEVTRIMTSNFDRAGLYVWHCHILSHEDHDMMRPLEVIDPNALRVTLNKPVANVGNKTGFIEANPSAPNANITKVEFYYGNTLLSIATTAPYRASWENAPDGHYPLSARVYDDQGNMAISNIVTVMVGHMMHPQITLTLNQPVADAGNKTGYIEAVASDPMRAIVKVEFYHGTTLLGTDDTAPYRASWSNAQNGAYVITAKAFDNTGGLTTSNAVQVIVGGTGNNIPPTITLKNPVGFNGNKNGAIEAIANDPDGKIVKVEFYNGTSLLSTNIKAPYMATWVNVPNGTYYLTAKAYDDKGDATISNTVVVIVNGQ